MPVSGPCGLTVSFFRNRALEDARVGRSARNRADESGGAAQELPSRDRSERLDTLRETVELLSIYEREGAPWSLRWGLYIGHDLYPSARASLLRQLPSTACSVKRKLALLEWLQKLPAKPGPSDEYKPTYDDLKGYLITTSHHEKSTRDLPVAAADGQLGGRAPGGFRRAPIWRGASSIFTATSYLSPTPFPPITTAARWSTRVIYLAQFNAIESIYQFIIAEASRAEAAR